MRITTQVEYGLRCLLFIARHQNVRRASADALMLVAGARHSNNGPVTIREICAKEKLPARYVEQLLLKLRRRKLIKSIRGARGGYVLNRPAGKISLKKAVEALEGATFEIVCKRYDGKKDKCIRYGKPCSLRLVWQLTRRKIDEALGQTTVAALLLRR